MEGLYFEQFEVEQRSTLSVQDTTFGTIIVNLGMSETMFATPLFAGDTIRAESTVAALMSAQRTTASA